MAQVDFDETEDPSEWGLHALVQRRDEGAAARLDVKFMQDIDNKFTVDPNSGIRGGPDWIYYPIQSYTLSVDAMRSDDYQFDFELGPAYESPPRGAVFRVVAAVLKRGQRYDGLSPQTTAPTMITASYQAAFYYGSANFSG